jgi:hypothetical protein
MLRAAMTAVFGHLKPVTSTQSGLNAIVCGG